MSGKWRVSFRLHTTEELTVHNIVADTDDEAREMVREGVIQAAKNLPAKVFHFDDWHVRLIEDDE